ncbi:MAG: monovalent cation/H+ antiporter complex subunit F [Anaerolineaceae bacterium]|jgi:multisubunit Na+/H+ antiporter MnhF subunit
MAEIVSNSLNIALIGSLGVHIILIGICVYRVWRGENVIDRLIGADLVGTLVLAILVLIGLIERTSIYFDVALGLAALGFVGSVVLAKYLADQKIS